MAPAGVPGHCNFPFRGIGGQWQSAHLALSGKPRVACLLEERRKKTAPCEPEAARKADGLFAVARQYRNTVYVEQ